MTSPLHPHSVVTPPAHTTTPSGGPAWTPERIRALGTVTTVPVAASIFGLSRSVAYDLIRTEKFPVPVLRFGSRYRIPVQAILAALHMPAEPPRRKDSDDLIDGADPRVDRRHEIPGSPRLHPGAER
ncbi:helix-turn-helix domain-containing protein [Actinoplanes sp. NPDC048791]|uniref:helix-turn-helix domain-containing protein n=1 Tax=Actinoplanes sp. NPDC048791 TaxID=3154623 RepID=UPI0033CC35D2